MTLTDAETLVGAVVALAGAGYSASRWVLPRLVKYYRMHLTLHSLYEAFGTTAGSVIKECLTTNSTDLSILLSKLDMVASHTQIGFYICDSDGRCTHFSAQLEKWFGISEASAKGYGWLASIRDPKKVYAEWEFSVSNNLPYLTTYEFRNISAAELVWHHAETVAVRLSANSPFWIGSVRIKT